MRVKKEIIRFLACSGQADGQSQKGRVNTKQWAWASPAGNQRNVYEVTRHHLSPLVFSKVMFRL